MKKEEMEALVDGISVKAEKIRRLFEAGAKRGEIARFLDITYGHVQTVLRRSGLAGGGEAAANKNADSVAIYTVTLGKDGVLTLPGELLEEQGLASGDELVCRSDGSGIRIMSRETALGEVTEAMRRSMPQEAALLETLLGRPEARPKD